MDLVREETEKEKAKRERGLLKQARFLGNNDSDDEDGDAGPSLKEKKALFPKGKKQSLEVEKAKMEDSTLPDPVRREDPRVAALARAKARKVGGSGMRLGDTDISNDVTGAEEDFQGEDEEKDEIEPFNLDKEREGGYFDAEGNYVEYRAAKEINDPWLASVEVDTRFATRAREMKEAAERAEQEDDLSRADIAKIKRRIADVLLPQETVLHALRRLGGKLGGGGGGGRGGGGRGRGGNSVGEEEKGKSKRRNAVPIQEVLAGESKEKFEQLTEDAMKLMDGGEFEVYSDKRETFLREAEGYEALERARSTLSLLGKRGREGERGGGGEKDSAGKSGEEEGARKRSEREVSNAANMDMFAEDEGTEEAGERGGGEGMVEEVRGGGREGGGEEERSREGIEADGSGYVFDPASGFYYNGDLGYYFDPSTSLYCSATTGLWYRFDETSNTYTEVEPT